MSEIRAANRYAMAIFGIADEMKKLDEVYKDIQLIDKTIKESRELFLFLKTPVVSTQKKKQILSGLFKGKLSEITMKFLTLLTSKNREGLLPEVIQQFYLLRDQRMGILNVTARTAVKFTGEQEKKLVSQLENITKKKINIKYLPDPTLKGGFTIQYEDTVWDASVKHQLELLKRRFIEGVV